MRGIVTTAGGPLYFLNAYLNLRLLREKGCSLPFEWFYLGAEMTPAQIREAEQIPGLRLVDLGGDCPDRARGNGGWQSKIEAIVESRFDDVLFLDADCFPVRDPEYLFDGPLFKEHGAVLWPDVWNWSEDANPHIAQAKGREFLNVKYGVVLPSQQVESGQMLFAKQRCATALEAVRALNRNSADTYSILYGDKDTFLIGFLQAEADFAINPHVSERFRGGLLQKDFEGEVLFAHLTDAKFQWHGRPLIGDCELPGATLGAAITRELIARAVHPQQARGLPPTAQANHSKELIVRGVRSQQARGLPPTPTAQVNHSRARVVVRRPLTGRLREELVRERLQAEGETARREQANHSDGQIASKRLR